MGNKHDKMRKTNKKCMVPSHKFTCVSHTQKCVDATQELVCVLWQLFHTKKRVIYTHLFLQCTVIDRIKNIHISTLDKCTSLNF